MSLTTADITTIRDIVIDAIDRLVVPRFDDIDKRFVAFETRLDNFETRFDTLENRFDNLEMRFFELQQDVLSMNIRLKNIETMVQDLQGRVEGMENDIKKIYGILKLIPTQDFADRKYNKLSPVKKLAVLKVELDKLSKRIRTN